MQVTERKQKQDGKKIWYKKKGSGEEWRRGEDRRNENGDEKKGFEFSTDDIVKSDKKVSVKLPKLKITRF